MIGVGEKFPEFQLKSCADVSGAFPAVGRDTYVGMWLVVVFWPKDFTFVCPTEILGYNALLSDFKKCNAYLLGASTDTDFVHLAWRKSDSRLASVAFPWLADSRKSLAGDLGILDAAEGVAYRATYIVDPEGLVRHVTVNDLSVGRNPQETLRTLEALQNGELCPASWRPGEKTLNAA
jgi:peroxiredoxin (alkyl hydroperoxide reductase subunit C)